VSAYWPLVDLRLRVGDLVLRPTVEADLDPLAAGLAASPDIELDPSLPAYDGLAPELARGRAAHQFYWRELGAWRPGSWRLMLVVERGAELVGTQDLKGAHFGELRTVESSSYVFRGHRRQGLAAPMRRAVLTLAFDHLGALAAETEAWHDNTASIATSRRVGYTPNGETLHDRDGRPDRMVRMRITREQWAATSGRAGVTVEGLEACRHLFG
jgi:RimJ/RimL family protein N-acetyltransferase